MTDWGGQTRPALQQACRDRGLPVSGNRDDLIKRLEQYEAEPPEITQPPAEDPPPAAPPAAPDPPETTAAPQQPDLRVWRIVRPVDPYDDETHQRLLAEVVTDAQERGYTTRGPAHREEYSNGLGTYAVHVRPTGG